MTRVSIVIPTRNNSDSIERLLESVRSQSVADHETIVVDGSSSDGTKEIAVRFGARLIQYVHITDMRSHARNLGARAAQGGILLFLDSDMELSPRVIEDCLDLHQRGHSAVMIPETNVGAGLLGLLRGWERDVVQRDIRLGFARSIEKSLFWELGGFDTMITGYEDIDLQARLLETGVRIARSSQPLFHHEEALTLGRYIRKRLLYARSAARFRTKHPKIGREVFSPISRLKLYLSGIDDVQTALLFLLAVGLRTIEQPFQ